MDRRHGAAAAGTLAVAVLLAACTDFVVDGEGVVATSGADSTAGESSEASSPSSAAAGTAAELRPTDGPLSPGTYTRSAFAPAITIELGAGWRAVQLFDGFFDIQRHDTIGTPDVVAVQFARPAGIAGPDGVTEPADAADAAQLLAGNDALAVVESSPSRIGGLDGHQVTVENGGEGHAAVLVVPPGPLGIDPGRRLWVAFFDTDDGLLAVTVGGSVAEWRAALDAAEPVLESIRIGG